jgi:hypothetical protein
VKLAHIELTFQLNPAFLLSPEIFFDENTAVNLTVGALSQEFANPIDVAHQTLLLLCDEDLLESLLFFGLNILLENEFLDTLR